MANQNRPKRLTEADLADEKMGNNQLQGNDQESVHNQRQEVPDVKTQTDGVVESFRKMDKDYRADKERSKREERGGDQSDEPGSKHSGDPSANT